MSDIWTQISKLPSERRRLLELMLEHEGVNLAKMPIPRRREGMTTPLSVVQERIFSLGHLTPSLPTENVPLALELVGPLALDRLQRAFNAVLQNHSILRTRIRMVDGNPIQEIRPHHELKLTVEDLREIPVEEREIVASARLVEVGGRPFDLENDLLIRPILLKLEDNRHYLLTSTHQLVVDGWALNLLLQELGEHYRQEKDQPAPTDAIEYADYAVWERSQVNSSGIAEQTEFWVKQLEGAPNLLEIPTDRPRPTAPSFEGQTVTFVLTPDLSSRLKAFARKEGVTLFNLLLTAFKLLLARYAESKDVIVGTLVSNRSRPETENVMGNFGNNLLLRTNLTGNPNFRELLQRVRETTMHAIANQEAPLEAVQARLEQTAQGRIPSFQFGFIFRDATTAQKLNLGSELDVQKLTVDLGVARLDLWLDMADAGNYLRGDLQYRSDLWESESMDRLVRHFTSLLSSVADDPDAAVSELGMLTEEDKARVVDCPAVEAVLQSHAAVRSAVVLPGDLLTGRGAVVYYVPAQDSYTTATELRKHLRDHLPPVTVPGYFVELDEIPRTPDGEIDLSALPDPLGRSNATGAYSPPVTETEQKLAEIWRTVLGIERVGVQDNFFDLGGHSLLATQVLGRMEESLGLRPEPTAIVMGTLRQLAARCDEVGRTAEEQARTEPTRSSRGLFGRMFRSA